MKDFQLTAKASGCILLALTCLVCIGNNGVAAVYTMDETCMYVPNNTYIGNPNNCAGWGFCRNSALYASGNCPTNYLYNTRTGRCDYPSNVQCQTTVQDVCSNSPSPTFVGNPNNCNEYCYCSATLAASCTNCPAGQVFSSDPPSCVWSTATDCSADSICRLVQDNTFVQNPAQCGQYIACFGGTSQNGPQSCSNTAYTYDTATGTCGPTNNCNGQTLPPSSNGPFPQNPTACNGAAVPSYISDGQTCGGYYVCSNDTATNGVWGKCPMGTQFNPDYKGGSCVTPYTYACKYNRCMNLNQSYVTAVNTGCKAFIYCQNQLPASGPLYCSDVNINTPYFNEAFGTCVATVPDFPICNSTTTTT